MDLLICSSFRRIVANFVWFTDLQSSFSLPTKKFEKKPRASKIYLYLNMLPQAELKMGFWI